MSFKQIKHLSYRPEFIEKTDDGKTYAINELAFFIYYQERQEVKYDKNVEKVFHRTTAKIEKMYQDFKKLDKKYPIDVNIYSLIKEMNHEPGSRIFVRKFFEETFYVSKIMQITDPKVRAYQWLNLIYMFFDMFTNIDEVSEQFEVYFGKLNSKHFTIKREEINLCLFIKEYLSKRNKQSIVNELDFNLIDWALLVVLNKELKEAKKWGRKLNLWDQTSSCYLNSNVSVLLSDNFIV